MIRLNAKEQSILYAVKSFIATAPKGSYAVSTLFPTGVANPRITRRIYEETIDGLIPRLSLVGKYSKDGYIIS